MSEQKYSVYADGYDIRLEGNLASDLEVKTTEGGKKYISLSIACNGGSKKEDSGWVQVTDWNNVTIWEWNGGNAADLINFVSSNTNDKTKFYKGNRVILIAKASKEITTGKDGKAYVNWRIHKFYDLYKPIPNGTKKTEETETTTQQPEDDF